MKRTWKIFAVLATVLALAAALTVFALGANTTASPDEGYAFEVYSIDTGKVTAKYTTSQMAQLRSILNGINESNDNIIITLLDDCYITNGYITCGAGSTSAQYNAETPFDPITNPAKNINVYLDLNGHDLIFDYFKTYTFIELGDGVNFNLYSSREGGAMHSIHQNSTANTGSNVYTIFNLRYNGASLALGECTPAAVRLNDGTGAYKTTNTTCDGDNLSVYGGDLFTTWYNTKTTGHQYSHGYDVTVDIKGGTYYRIKNNREAFMLVDGAARVTAQDATFVSVNTGVLFGSTDSSYADKGSSAYFRNCTFIGDTLLYQSNGVVPTTMDSCYIACDNLITHANTTTVSPTYNSCYFTAGLLPDTSYEIVNTSISKNYSLNAISYNYADTTFDDTAAYSTTKLNTSNPFNLNTADRIIDYKLTTTPLQNVAQITWVGIDGTTVTEKWVKGSNVIPTPAIIPPASNGACRYVYTPEIAPTSNGDATYTMVRTVNFPVKTNLTLYADFVYNIYIPKDIIDSGCINYIKFAGEANIDMSSLTVTDINGKSYYTVKKDIPVVNGDKSFSFIINVSDSEGTAFSAEYTLSIPAYINSVLSGSYTEPQKDMVRATSTYIKAARNCYTSSQTLPYPEASNPDLTALTHRPGVKMDEVSEELKAIFHSATLSLDEQTRFRFYIKNTTTEEQRKMVFTYPVNTYKTVDAVTSEDWKDAGNGLLYYDIVMKARDLRNNITVSLGTEEKETPDLNYRLAYYAYYVNDTANDIENRDRFSRLVDALWNYSLAALRYVHGTGTPDVNLVVAGNNVTADTHVIVASGDALEAATALRDAIYEVTGEQLIITGTESSELHNIMVTLDTPVVDYDMRAAVTNGELSISFCYKSFTDAAMSEFINEYISSASSDIVLENGFSDNYYTDRIYYSDFGAIGNGESSKATDFAAINNTHIMANLTKRHTVYANDNAHYYIDGTNVIINGTVTTVSVKTSVNWGNAKFTIDDSKLGPLADPITVGNTTVNQAAVYQRNIFSIDSDYAPESITDTALLNSITINPGTTKIDLGLGYPAMIVPTNTSELVFRRHGYGSWKGVAMKELIVIDENGNVDRDTPIIFDYTKITGLTVYRLDIKPVTVEGGVFHTISSNIDTVDPATGNVRDAYFARGLNVSRSFTTVKNVEHKVTESITLEERAGGKMGPAYNGFYYSSNASEVTFDGCILVGRRYYTQGTYDIGGGTANKMVFRNCTQSNFWVNDNGEAVAEGTAGAKLSMATSTKGGSKKMYWGIGGTNYCKNMEYHDSTLSRFDAHAGLYNGKIINSTVNYISIVGNGTFIVENTRWFAEGTGPSANSLIHLRIDYGSTWDGDIIIRNVQAYPYTTSTTSISETYLVYHEYVNWYYGYSTHFPNLHVDNLDYYNMVSRQPLPAGQTIKLVPSNSMTAEPNMHLAETKNKAPYHYPMDADGDGWLDESNGTVSADVISGMSNISTGYLVSSSRVNLNPVSAPDYIHIYQNDGVDGAGGYNFVIDETVAFLSATDIIVTADAYDGPPVPDVPDEPDIPDVPEEPETVIQPDDTPIIGIKPIK